MSRKAKRYIKFAQRTFWGVLLIGIISLAVIVQVGRLLFPALDQYRDEVQASLSKQLRADIKIGALSGDWQGLRPQMSIADVVVSNPKTGDVIFTVDSVVVEASILSSIRTWRPSIRKLYFVGLEGSFNQDEAGKWAVSGMSRSAPVQSGGQGSGGAAIIDDPLDLFLFGRRISLVDTRLQFDFRNDLSADVTIPTIALENDADFHRLVAEFKTDRIGQSLRLVVEGIGDPREEDKFNAHGYLQLADFPSAQVLAALGVSANALLKSDAPATQAWQDDGLVNMQAWFSGTPHRGLNWSGKLAVDGVPFTAPQGVVWPQRTSAQFKGAWTPNQGWNMALSQLAVDWTEFAGPRVNAQLIAPVDTPSTLLIDAIDIEQWRAAALYSGLLGKDIGSVVSDLSPYGQLSRVKLTQLPAEQGYFKLAADIDKAGVNDWAGVPAIEGVSGFMEATAFDGHVQLQSFEGFRLNFPEIYKTPLDFQTAVGDVRWAIDLERREVGVSSGLLEVAKTDVSARGYLHLQLPFGNSPGKEPQMTLAIGIEQGFADLHRLLVPYTVPKELYNWMGRSIKSGKLYDGAFIYHGTLAHHSELARVLQLSVIAEQAQLEFDPSWPQLRDANAHLLLDDSRFNVAQLSGVMDGVEISQGTVSLQQLEAEQGPALALRGDISCASQDCLRFLKNSPIRDLLGAEVMSWTLQGQMRGDVRLLVPLEKEREQLARQRIELSFSDNQLQMPSLDLAFEDLNGNLYYDQDKGLQIESLRGSLWGQPLEAQIRTVTSPEAGKLIEVEFEGQMAVADLNAWLRRPELLFFDGVSAINGLISVGEHSEGISLTARSDLLGVEVDLPPPLGKRADQAASFTMSLDQVYADGQALQDIALQYTHEIPLKALLRHNYGELQGLSVALGELEPQLETGAILIKGDLERSDGLAWYEAIETYLANLELDPAQYLQAAQSASQNEQDGDPPHSDSFEKDTGSSEVDIGDEDPFATAALPVKGAFHWQTMSLDNLVFQNLSLNFFEQQGLWSFMLNSPDIAGQIQYRDEDHPIVVNLQHLALREEVPATEGSPVQGQAEPAAELLEQDGVEGLGTLDVSTIPAASVTLEQWRVDERDMGGISFDLIPVAGGVAAYNLVWQLPNCLISGPDGGAEVHWLRSDAGDTTYFDGTLKAGDIGSVFTAWDFEKALTSKSAAVTMSLQWPGAPDAMQLEALSGVVDLNLKRGLFVRGAEVGENPLVKLVGLLNFDSLARRLRLDFSDLSPVGLGYEKIKGSLVFRSGIVDIKDPLKVDMPASELQLVGLIDVREELMDTELVATLPLAGNLTFAAALTAGIPTAVGVFVFGKLFKKQMDKVSSLRYRMVGSWEDPNVKLEKIFDNEPKTGK